MSSTPDLDRRKPLIVLLDRANRAMQQHMANMAAKRGYPQARYSHNAVFGRLGVEGARASDLAARAGVTRQSMGEVIREMVELGILEMRPDPADKRAKLVTYTEEGLARATIGFNHIMALEERFAEEFGEEEYESARTMLERVVGILAEVEADEEWLEL
jgi:DNA-binding MarR family transcriptional regulator